MTPSTVSLFRLLLLVAFSALLLASYLFERSGPRYRRWFTASFTILALASVAGSYLFIHVGADAARHLQGYFGSIRLFVFCLLMGAVEVVWALKAKIGRGINPA